MASIKIVLDTNVLGSGLINANGFPGRIVDLVRNNIVQLIIDSRIMEEYMDVLTRDRFKSYFSKYDADIILDFIWHSSYHTVSSVIVTNLPDKGDIPFLETALTAKASLITGNMRHFPDKLTLGCTVLTPEQFVKSME